MRRSIALSLAFLAITSMVVAADPLYKWVDDQGNVHYSDKPQPGAKMLVLPKVTTYTAPETVQSSDARENVHHGARAIPAYKAMSIASPKDQEVLWNVTSVTVSVTLEPSLNPGDTVTITLDGKSQTVSAMSATFDDLDRGEHSVTASVAGSGGSLTAKSVIFYIQKNTKKPH